jgi:hypothetical protein
VKGFHAIVVGHQGLAVRIHQSLAFRLASIYFSFSMISAKDLAGKSPRFPGPAYLWCGSTPHFCLVWFPALAGAFRAFSL